MINDGCKDIPKLPPGQLPVVNGVQLCARRDTMYNYLNTKRPDTTTNADGSTSYLCNVDKWTTLCSFEEADSDKYAFCVPTDSMCPVRHVQYRNGVLSAPTDSRTGHPVIDLHLSEGGPPCALYNDYFNV